MSLRMQCSAALRSTNISQLVLYEHMSSSNLGLRVIYLIRGFKLFWYSCFFCCSWDVHKIWDGSLHFLTINGAQTQVRASNLQENSWSGKSYVHIKTNSFYFISTFLDLLFWLHGIPILGIHRFHTLSPVVPGIKPPRNLRKRLLGGKTWGFPLMNIYIYRDIDVDNSWFPLEHDL